MPDTYFWFNKEKNVIFALLNYPKDFINITKDYYLKQKSWDEEVFVSRFKEKIENDIFKLIDYIGEKNSSSAVKILNDMIQEGESVLGIFAMISRQFKTVLQVKQLQIEGVTINDICKRLNIRQFVVNKALKQSRNFSDDTIIDMLNFILENDFKIKNGLIKDTLAVEILVSKYCQRNIS